MTTAKIHYRGDASFGVEATQRVAVTCGAITVQAVPQLMVMETRTPDKVTCKNCLRRMR